MSEETELATWTERHAGGLAVVGVVLIVQSMVALSMHYGGQAAWLAVPIISGSCLIDRWAQK